VRSPIRIPAHRPVLRPRPIDPGEDADAEEENRFDHRPCYVFNPGLRAALDDTHCTHCRFYLTSRCPHIDEFLDDVEDLSPD
jgi:hypothetical protein